MVLRGIGCAGDTIYKDVGGLQQRIPEEAVGAEIFVLDVVALLFVGWHALKPAKRRDHGEQQEQLGVLRYVRLDEECRLLGIESGGEPVERDLQRIFFHAGGVGVVGGERVPVGDEKKAIVLAGILQIHPVL